MAAEPGDLGRVLVTGANGHLGRRLAERLRRREPSVRVRALVRSQRAAAALEPLVREHGLEVAVVDYADADALAQAADGCRAAVHLVGILKENRHNRYADAHERASEALARAADAAGLTRIAVLGIPGAHPGSRNACLASKGRAERILLAAKTPAVILRVPMVLGEGDAASRALARQARASLVFMVDGGHAHAQPIYAGDVVDALVAAVERPGLEGRALDLAGPESLPRRELAARAARVLGRAPPRIAPVPRALALLAARAAERLLPDPPVTPAMLEIVTADERIDAAPVALALGLALTPLDDALRRCVAGGEAR